MKTHREIAEQLDLFHSEPDAPGMIFWHPNGWRLFQAVQEHMRRVYRRHGFAEIRTPQFLKKGLWETSGHWEKFADNMFVGGDVGAAAEYALKPMSCPAHILYFKRGLYSYRDLPYRVFEFGTVHRNEPSGALNGCLRLRQFTQDDAHVFCDWAQAPDEIGAFLARARQVYGDYGFGEIALKIATRPANAFGAAADWERAEQVLAEACRAAGYAFEFQVGEGAFYGPKIEIALSDALGRAWQCGTIQLDFNMPERFDIHYVQAANESARPVILHQAMYGSIERWIGILLESRQGKLPAWVHPLPVALATISAEARAYAREVERLLQDHDLPLWVEDSDNTIAYKVRRFHDLTVPVVLVVGKQEQARRTVSLREADGKSRVLALDDLPAELRRRLAPDHGQSAGRQSV